MKKVFLRLFLFLGECLWNREETPQKNKFRGSIVASISACHADDRGSIPRHGVFYFFTEMSILFLLLFYHQRPKQNALWYSIKNIQKNEYYKQWFLKLQADWTVSVCSGAAFSGFSKRPVSRSLVATSFLCWMHWTTMIRMRARKMNKGVAL